MQELESAIQKIRRRAESALGRLTAKRRELGLPVDDLPPLDDWEAELARQHGDARVREAEARVARLRAEVEERLEPERVQVGHEDEPPKRKRRRKKAKPEPKAEAVTTGTRRYEHLELVHSDGWRSPVDQRDPRVHGPNDIGRDVPVDESGRPRD
jgi:hypothetical protein